MFQRSFKYLSNFTSIICNQTMTSFSLPPLSAPCAVQSVLNTLNCSTNILTTSWAAGPPLVNYSVTAVDGAGTVLLCMTKDSSCTITSLQCGQQYTVTVRAISSTCEGFSSVPEIVHSGKFVCRPEE